MTGYSKVTTDHGPRDDHVLGKERDQAPAAVRGTKQGVDVGVLRIGFPSGAGAPQHARFTDSTCRPSSSCGRCSSRERWTRPSRAPSMRVSAALPGCVPAPAVAGDRRAGGVRMREWMIGDWSCVWPTRRGPRLRPPRATEPRLGVHAALRRAQLKLSRSATSARSATNASIA